MNKQLLGSWPDKDTGLTFSDSHVLFAYIQYGFNFLSSPFLKGLGSEIIALAYVDLENIRCIEGSFPSYSFVSLPNISILP